MIEIRCEPLATASVRAECKYDDEWISCKSPVPPKTRATLTCENSYRPETNQLQAGQRRKVRCNTNGQWEPEPMRCIPGPLTINIYINDTKLVVFHSIFDRNNATFIEVLNDRVIIHSNARDPNYPDINIRAPQPNAADEPWPWF